MDKNIKENQHLKMPKEEGNRSSEESVPTSLHLNNVIENIAENMVRPTKSTRFRSTSCNNNCIDHLLPKSPSGRKRKSSPVSCMRGSKKRRSSIQGKPGKLLKKKIERAGRKSKDTRSKRIVDKLSDKIDDKLHKTDYNKRLDCLAQFGRNFYCPSLKQRTGLRPIYIDGSNVAFSHGQNDRFSVQGLQICIDYFRKRGHEVKAFVPHFRLRKGETTDQDLLHKLIAKKLVITTPTLYIKHQRRSPYDDWYIVQSAAANGGIIVSADNFQDIIKWNPKLRSVIEECRLVPTFVDDMIIFPVDPHGNRQNNLEQFLKF